jgi:hypothetical protein
LKTSPFDEYVQIKGGRGQRQNISSARQAADWLLYKWQLETDTDKAWRARTPSGHPLRHGKTLQHNHVLDEIVRSSTISNSRPFRSR